MQLTPVKSSTRAMPANIGLGWNCKKRVAAHNKLIFFLKIFFNLHEHYNYLQFTQIRNHLLKDGSIVWLGLCLRG